MRDLTATSSNGVLGHFFPAEASSLADIIRQEAVAAQKAADEGLRNASDLVQAAREERGRRLQLLVDALASWCPASAWEVSKDSEDFP